MNDIIEFLRFFKPQSLRGLAAEALKCNSAKEFEKDYIVEIKHGTYWHVTEDPNFQIDPLKGPKDMSSMANGQMTKGALMVTTDLRNWVEHYGELRAYAAEIGMSGVPKSEFYQVRRGFGNEFWVKDSSKAKVLRVMPVKEALRLDKYRHTKMTGSYGELEAFYNRVWKEFKEFSNKEINLNMNKMAKTVSGNYSWCYIELPKYIEKKILEFGNQIDKEDLFEEEAEGGLEMDTHITLKYELLTDRVKDIKDIFKKEKGGKVTITKSSIFETEDYDVVKMSVESDDLQRLHNKVNNLPHEDKYPEYIPHCTIAYVKKGCGKKYDGQFKLDKSFRFNEIFFGNRDNRNYRILLTNGIKKAANNAFLRVSEFSKKLFSYSAIRGEWWIMDGNISFADGDVGDMNHDAYVIDHIRRKFCDDEHFDRMDYIDWDGYENSIKENCGNENPETYLKNYLMNELGMNLEEIQIARGNGDPKGYAVKNYGWKKVNGNNVSTWTLTANDLSEIADGLSEAMESEGNEVDEEFNIYVESNGIVFRWVPLSVIERKDVNALMEYR